MASGGYLNIRTPDGRELEVLVTAPETVRGTLIYHGGTPTAAVQAPSVARAAHRHGLQVVQWSRPGYGRSTSRPGRSVADLVDDGAAVRHALGIEDFLALGWSGGGPHALAHAALEPQRCRAAAVLGGAAPREAVGLDWSAGMGEENLLEFGAAEQGAQVLGEFLAVAGQGLTSVTAAGVAEGLGDLVDEVDRSAVGDVELVGTLAAGLQRALMSGTDGWRDDDLAFVTPWGFDLDTITSPVAVWQGEHDRMVPASHGRWLAAAIPGAVLHLEPTEGHLSLDRRLGDIIDELVDLGRRPS